LPRTPWALVALFVAGAMTLSGEKRVDAADGGYSTYGASIVDYSLASKLLGRRLDEVGIVPPGDAQRSLLVVLHGRHDPLPHASSEARTSGPESMLSNALFAGLARLGKDAPVVVLLNGGQH